MSSRFALLNLLLQRNVRKLYRNIMLLIHIRHVVDNKIDLDFLSQGQSPEVLRHGHRRCFSSSTFLPRMGT